MAWIKLNATDPAAPAGARNVHFRQEAGHAGTQADPIKTSAFIMDKIGVIGAIFDGGNSTPTAGRKAFIPYMPFNATITLSRMIGDASGSAQITIKKSSYADFPTTVSIVASAPPKLITQQKNEDSTLSGWTLDLVEGDVIEFILDSASILTWVGLALKVEKS